MIIKKFILSIFIVIVLTVLLSSNALASDAIKLKSREIQAQGMYSSLSLTEGKNFIIQFSSIPSESERNQLEASGIKLISYIPEKAWVARITNRPRASSLSSLNIRAMVELMPEDKIDPALLKKQYSKKSLNKDSTLNLIVKLFENTELSDLNAKVLSFNEKTNTAYINIKVDDVLKLAANNQVRWVDQQYESVVFNDGIRKKIQVEELQASPHYLNGSGIIIGEWDGGWVDNTHDDLQGRVTIGDLDCTESYCNIDDHATHVGGTLLGNGALSEARGGTQLQWRGMAPAASLISYEWWGDTPTEITDEYTEAFDDYNIDISTNSWGWGGFGFFGIYDSQTQDIDFIARGSLGKKIPILFAAGNDGKYGFGSIGMPATAKNVISVGASNSDTDKIASFSSLGPTLDGRIKPDIVAPGCEKKGERFIKSTLPGDAYGGKGWCGTSMATPAAAGSIALILQKYNQLHPDQELLPSTIKSLLITSAVDNWKRGPDFTFGFGRINISHAIEILSNIIEDQVATTGQTKEYPLHIIESMPNLRVTLAWDDYPADLLAAKALVNDLDLVLVDPNGTEYLPWVLDPLNHSRDAIKGIDSTNNVEQLEIENPLLGEWKIRVKARTLPYMQNFSITYGHGHSNIYIPPASLTGLYSDYGIDADNDGKFNYLAINLSVNVTTPGDYEVSADLSDSLGSFIDDVHEDIDLDQPGLYNIQLLFSGYNIRNYGINGAYNSTSFLISNIRLEKLDNDDDLIVEEIEDAYITKQYNYTDFDTPGASLTDLYSDYGIDLDNDSKFDLLTIEAGVNVTEAGIYEVEAELSDASNKFITWIDEEVEFKSGLNTLLLNFSGTRIYSHNTSGPYLLREILLIQEFPGKDLEADSKFRAYNTSAYNYTNFNEPRADQFEPDDNFTVSKPIATNSTIQHHTQYLAGDQDWIKFSAVAGVNYTIKTFNLLDETDTLIFLYDTDGVTLLAENDDQDQPSIIQPIPPAPPQPPLPFKKRSSYILPQHLSVDELVSQIIFTPQKSGTYFVKIEAYEPDITYGEYDLSVTAQTYGSTSPEFALMLTEFFVDEDITLTFNLTAIDPNILTGDVLTFSANDSRFTLTKLNDNIVLVNFTPTNSDVGNFSVKFTVSDLTRLQDHTSINISVLNTNDPPKITSFSPIFSDPKIPLNSSQLFSVISIDEDLGDILATKWYVDDIQAASNTSNFTFISGNSTGNFTIKAIVTDGIFNVSKEWLLTVADRPVATKFDPNLTTDFSNITDLSNVSDVKVGKSEGQLKFNNNLDLRNVVDIDNAINISTGFVEVKTSIVPEFANKPATLTMNNLNTIVFTKKPLIKVTFENGTSNNDCETLGLCTNASWINNTLKFDILHFTSFQAVANTTQETQPSKLVFDKIKIVMPSHKETVINGDTVDKVKPGDSIEVEVDVRNSFADTTEIHDVNLEGVIEKIDNGDDLEDDSQDFDLDAGDDKKISLNFNIPYNADKIAYKLRLKVSGQDSAGKTHEQSAVVSLLIDKKTHALAISKLSLNTPSVRCTRTVELTVKVNNIGENEEDDTVLRLTQPELSFNVKENEELDEGSADDDDNSALEKRYVISVPRDFNPGTYPIAARAFYDGTKLSDEKSIDLFVEDCLEVKAAAVPQATQAQRTAKATTSGKLQASTSQQTQLIVTNVESTVPEELPQQQPQLFDEEMYITLLAVGFILLFGLCALFAMVLVMKRR